jgi:branched-chain amino acid transport system substrate-binding protein
MIADSNPSKKVASEYVKAYEKLNGASRPPSAPTCTTGLLLQAAIPTALAGKPGTRLPRGARCAGADQGVAGHPGRLQHEPGRPQRLDERGREMIVVKNGHWTLLK